MEQETRSNTLWVLLIVNAMICVATVVYSHTLLPESIAFWIFSFDIVRVRRGWDWGPEQEVSGTPLRIFLRCLIADLIGPNTWVPLVAGIIVFMAHPVNVPLFVLYVVALTFVSASLREWSLRSEPVAPWTRSILSVLAAWALACLVHGALSGGTVGDYLFDPFSRFSENRVLIAPLLLGAMLLFQAIAYHPKRNARLMKGVSWWAY